MNQDTQARIGLPTTNKALDPWSPTLRTVGTVAM
jgi:hypothetical protein